MYHIREKSILNTTVYPSLGRGPQLAAVAKIKRLVRDHNAKNRVQRDREQQQLTSGVGVAGSDGGGSHDVRVVSLAEALPFARRECLAKVARQRRVAKHFR